MKLVSIYFFCMFFCINGKMPLYAIYTDSHKELLEDWFLPSMQDDFDLHIKKYEQECPSGAAFMPGFKKTVSHKLEVCLAAIEENWGNIFIFSDVDIIFFSPIEKEINKLMSGYDILFQQDSPYGEPCSGFFVCRANKTTKKLFKAALDLMINDPKIHGDQDALAHFFYSNRIINIKWALLPTSFCSGGTFVKRMWWPGDDLQVPDKLHLFHASFANGTKDKIKMMQYVQNKYSKNNINNSK